MPLKLSCVISTETIWPSESKVYCLTLYRKVFADHCPRSILMLYCFSLCSLVFKSYPKPSTMAEMLQTKM